MHALAHTHIQHKYKYRYIDYTHTHTHTHTSMIASTYTKIANDSTSLSKQFKVLCL